MIDELSARLRSEFGLNLHWDPRDREEVRRYNKELWKKWKEEHGYSPYTPAEKIPGFLKTIEQLGLKGYGFVDIGVTFGLTNERIRQYFEKCGLKRNEANGHPMHIRGDWEEIFSPIMGRNLEEVLREQKWLRKDEEHEKIRQTHVKAIQDFYKEVRRVPTTKELAKMFGYANISGIARYWGYRDGLSYKESLDILYFTAGFKERRISGGGRAFITRQIAA